MQSENELPDSELSSTCLSILLLFFFTSILRPKRVLVARENPSRFCRRCSRQIHAAEDGGSSKVVKWFATQNPQ